MRQLTEEEAIAFSSSKEYTEMTKEQIAHFQMNQKLLCVPFSIFHEAMEHTLKRPIWTHEFGLNAEGLRQELKGLKEAPSMNEIINLIPHDKLIVIKVEN